MAIYRLLLFRWAPLVYLVTALPAAILVAFLSPPFQRTDEDRQFLHAVQQLGGRMPADAAKFIEAFRPVADHPETRAPRAAVAAARGLGWTPAAAAEPDSSPKTGVFGWPVEAGLGLGRTIGLDLYDSYTVGRVFHAVTAVALGAVAIGMALHGRALVFWLLGLPTVLSLAGTGSPDATLTAAVALAVGLCSRAVGRDEPIGPGWRLVMALLIGFAVATRLTYLPLLVLLLTQAVRPERARSSFDSFLVALGPFCLAVAVIVGSLLAEGAATHLQPLTLASLSLQAEADWLREHLPGLWETLRDVLTRAGADELQAFVALFSDRPIIVAFSIAWLVAFVVAAALAFVEEGDAPPFGTGMAMLFWGAVAALATIITVSLATPSATGPDTADLHARLLMPLAALLALIVPGLIVPRWNRAYSGFGTVFAIVGWLAIFALAVLRDWLVLPPVLLNRFYL